jgi:hypothetical protein
MSDDETPIDLSRLLGDESGKRAPGAPSERASGSAAPAGHPGHGANDEWSEALARTVAHLAAQLTVAQLRLRALGSAIAARGLVDPAEVDAYLAAQSRVDGGLYLRENLGEALVDVIDVDALEQELIAYLTSPGGGAG